MDSENIRIAFFVVGIISAIFVYKRFPQVAKWKRWVNALATVMFVSYILNLTNGFVRDYRSFHDTDYILASYEKQMIATNPFIKVFMEDNPEAWDKFAVTVIEGVKSTNGKGTPELQAFYAKGMAEFRAKVMPKVANASDATIVELVKADLELNRSLLKESPVQCVKRSVGQLDIRSLQPESREALRQLMNLHVKAYHEGIMNSPHETNKDALNENIEKTFYYRNPNNPDTRSLTKEEYDAFTSSGTSDDPVVKCRSAVQFVINALDMPNNKYVLRAIIAQ